VGANHSLYSAFQIALYPSGTFGGGGPEGGANSLIVVCDMKLVLVIRLMLSDISPAGGVGKRSSKK
jgi:hypothetical protein